MKAIYSDAEKATAETEIYFNVGKHLGILCYLLSEILQIEGGRILLDIRVGKMLKEMEKSIK